jgi:hypothetical protein
LKIEHSISTKVPATVVFDWWTDLREGEIIGGGKDLRSIRVLRREGNTIVVESEWRFNGRRSVMKETLVRNPASYSWTVRPEGGTFRVDIVDEFKLEPLHQGARLNIVSEVKGRGLRGKLLLLFMGWKLKQAMIEEWDYAIKSLEAERLGGNALKKEILIS